MEFHGKIALVTGASRGIGQAIALELARNGATVIGTSTSEAGAEAITTLFHEKQLQGQGMVLDVSKKSSIDPLMEQLKSNKQMPHILVNNAAITRDNLLMTMRDEEWLDVIETNLSAVFYLSRHCMRDMLRARWGRIITIGSVVGLMGNPGQVNYASAKAGLGGFTRALAQEIGKKGITVNLVAPGFIDTDMTRVLSEEQRQALLDHIPLKRLGTVDDIASAVTFLASERASYITGETLNVNGGMYMA